MKLIPIKYHGIKYPNDFLVNLYEVAAHFDKNKLPDWIKNYGFSLHTEYSAGKRKFDNNLLQDLKTLVPDNIPKSGKVANLWESEQWAKEFAIFIIRLLNGKIPKIIEIHPPNNRPFDMDKFLKYYKIFYTVLQQNKINSEISIENRNFPKFMLSGIKDFELLSKKIDNENIPLKMILDIPQLLNFEKAYDDEKKLIEVLKDIKKFKHNISSIHLWGMSPISHNGDMLDYFKQNKKLKDTFFIKLFEIFEDSTQDLYFIPEINGGSNGKSNQECLNNIINDLEEVGFEFYKKVHFNKI